MLDSLVQYVPTFVLVFFRILGLMMFAPLLGSTVIPKRVKGLFAAVLALGIAPGIATLADVPGTTWELSLGIAGEMLFGVTMGMVMSFVFIAAQWAGEIVGQQMGLNMGAVFDPQFGQSGSLVGTMYFMLSQVIFLSPPINGHHAMLRGLRQSFDTLPLLSVGVTRDLLDMILGLLTASTMLAVQMAAPVLITMIVVDLAMGFVGKTMPQLNIMSAGLSIRAILGMILLVIGLMLTGQVIQHAMERNSGSIREMVGG